MSYANNKGADQPAHPCSLISAFVVCCLDSIISLDSIAEILRLQLASVAAQAGLCLAWSKTPEDTFCHVEVHVHFCSTDFPCSGGCYCNDPKFGQTLQTQIRLLLEEQSDQGLHCLPFSRHCLAASFCG